MNNHYLCATTSRVMKKIFFCLGLLLSLLNCEARELQLPSIPSTMTMPQERAAYLLAHFWDNLDFTDDAAIADVPFMAQNFANFASVFPVATPEAIEAGIDTLLSKASVNKDALELMVRIADDYLYETDSPVYNEEHYILFLNRLLASPYLDTTAKMRPEFQLKEAMKNRVGHSATDFEFTDREGQPRKLSDIRAKDDILLIFFNPDCDHCRQVLHELQNDSTRKAEIDSGWLTVVAIYSGDEADAWKEYAATLPDNWIVGIEPMKVLDDEIYVLREFPTVYLLDKNLIVKAKNIALSKGSL